MCIGVLSVCMCATCVPGIHRAPKSILDPLGLELQMVGNCYVLGVEPGSSARATCAEVFFFSPSEKYFMLGVGARL